MTYPGHEHVPWLAFVEAMDHEHLFSFRWYDSETPSSSDKATEPSLLVEFELTEIPTGTRLTITESGFSNLPASRRIELMRGNREGWDIQAGHLATYLQT